MFVNVNKNVTVFYMFLLYCVTKSVIFNMLSDWEWYDTNRK